MAAVPGCTEDSRGGGHQGDRRRVSRGGWEPAEAKELGLGFNLEDGADSISGCFGGGFGEKAESGMTPEALARITCSRGSH